MQALTTTPATYHPELKNAVWEKSHLIAPEKLKPPKFIVANKNEVKLDEMFKSIQQVKGLSVRTTPDTNK